MKQIIMRTRDMSRDNCVLSTNSLADFAIQEKDFEFFCGGASHLIHVIAEVVNGTIELDVYLEVTDGNDRATLILPNGTRVSILRGMLATITRDHDCNTRIDISYDGNDAYAIEDFANRTARKLAASKQ